MSKRQLFKDLEKYDKTKPKKVMEFSGLLGIGIRGKKRVEVPNREGFVYVRLRNSTNELIQAFNEKVSPVFGLPVLVRWETNRYVVVGRDTNRYASNWGTTSAFLPRHGGQHSLNFDSGQGGDITYVYSRQFMPFASIPSGTDGANVVYVAPHVYRNPVDASWNYIGDTYSPDLTPANPTGSFSRMMLLYWDLDDSSVHVMTGTYFSAIYTGTVAVLPYVPNITNIRHVPLSAVRLVSGTTSILWDNIYDMRQWTSTTPPTFQGGFVVQDEGVALGTGSVLNFVGDNVTASVSGSVVRVYVTGSFGGGGNVSGSIIGDPYSVVLTNASGTIATMPWIKWGTNTGFEYLDLAGDQVGREVNAGKMGYMVFDNMFDIVGAGTGVGVRDVKVYDNLYIGSSLFVPNLASSYLLGANANGQILNSGISTTGTFIPFTGAMKDIDLNSRNVFMSGTVQFGNLTQIMEGKYLQIGAAVSFPSQSPVFPTTSYIGFGDDSPPYGPYVRLREVYDDALGISISTTGSGLVFVSGWDDGYTHIRSRLGDLETLDHGNFLDVTYTGTVINSPVWAGGSVNIPTGSSFTVGGVPHNHWVAAPATATSAGTAGQMAYDGSFLYICTATNTWRRAAIASW